MKRTVRFTYAQSAAMFVLLVALALLGFHDIELFFFTSLLVFLIITELTTLSAITPRWRKRLRWFVAVGLVGLAYLVGRHAIVVIQ